MTNRYALNFTNANKLQKKITLDPLLLKKKQQMVSIFVFEVYHVYHIKAYTYN